MKVVGLSGGVDLAGQRRFVRNGIARADAAAVLVSGGEVVSAIEEERPTREPHTNTFPEQGLRFCLRESGVDARDVDAFVFAMDERIARIALLRHYLGTDQPPNPLQPAGFLAELLQRSCGSDVDPSRCHFLHHHEAHAWSAFAMAGQSSALVVTMDGEGDGVAGRFQVGTREAARVRLEPLATIGAAQSIGHFYRQLMNVIGFRYFEEYKVMGLAPYGDAARYRGLIARCYTLLERGQYALHPERYGDVVADLRPRKRTEPLEAAHRDFAAALQEATERLLLHVLTHYQAMTGLRQVCLAGGVAHNCSAMGKLLQAGLFDDVFVQPASHDAGCAVGAALWYAQTVGGAPVGARVPHVYWGTDIGDAAAVEAALADWAAVGAVEIERVADVETRTAQLLADGCVVGWVQGRAEFGPRALGNRSILADPRPMANRDRVNAMVKKREAFRPFAPAVTEDAWREYFEAPATVPALPYMMFAVPVRAERRALLGAVTHVDGTARVQTVTCASNPKFWRLLRAFAACTGVPVLLNTSFNNHVEPIVDSVTDAVTTFLTTGIDVLVAGDYVVRKAAPLDAVIDRLVPSIPAPFVLERELLRDGRGWTYRLASTVPEVDGVEISASVWELLKSGPDAAGHDRAELLALWTSRHLVLRPPATR